MFDPADDNKPSNKHVEACSNVVLGRGFNSRRLHLHQPPPAFSCVRRFSFGGAGRRFAFGVFRRLRTSRYASWFDRNEMRLKNCGWVSLRFIRSSKICD